MYPVKNAETTGSTRRDLLPDCPVKTEVENTVKAMKNNKQPGKDGIMSAIISSAVFICASY